MQVGLEVCMHKVCMQNAHFWANTLQHRWSCALLGPSLHELALCRCDVWLMCGQALALA